MEKARKFVSVIRNNWKKSVFFTIVGGYGANWYNKKLQDDAYMAELSREALTHGSGLIHGASTPLYRVTVILNPVASGGKGRKYYEKYCAPLLNLAGMKVIFPLFFTCHHFKVDHMILWNVHDLVFMNQTICKMFC